MDRLLSKFLRSGKGRGPDRIRLRDGAPNAPSRGGMEPAGRLLLARAALAWEALWPKLWPALAVVGLFLSVAWLDIPGRLPGPVHLVLLLGTFGAVGFMLRRALRGFAFPGEEQGRRRIERDSKLSHRPLTVLKDRPAGGGTDPLAAALWRAAQARARRQTDALTVNAPHPNLAARDPWALRAAVVLVVAASGVVAWGDWGQRLGLALTPRLSWGPVAPAALEAWVTPPDYTGLPPIILTRIGAAAAKGDAKGDPQPVPIPTGSTLLVKVTGGYGTPKLIANNGAETVLKEAGTDAWQADATITGGTTLVVRQAGRTLREWPVIVVPDQGPGIAFRSPPAATERFSTRIDYTAADDYGVVKATATVRLVTPVPDVIDRTPIVLPLPLPGAAPREAKGTGFHDLTPHPWAGLDVVIALEATDAAGQTGTAPERPFTLPERPFNHPVARAIIAERKKLTLGGDPMREPVARAVAELSARPGAYFDDTSAFLALRAAVNRLMLDAEPEALREVQDMLWEAALRIEDGGLSMAERQLRDAQERLAEAMDRNASDAELDQLMAELEQAMRQFLDAMDEQMRQAQQEGRRMPDLPMDPNTQTLDRSDIERMMEQMRELSRTGSKDAAREMLSQLQQMLEGMQTGRMDQQEAEQAEQMAEAMRELQDLAQQQRALMDETFRQSQEQEGAEPQQGQQGQQGPQGQASPGQQGPNRQGRAPQQGGSGMQGQQQGQQQQGRGQGQQNGQAGGDMAARQDELRRQLGRMMQRFGEQGAEIPRPFGRAEQAMRDAQEALRQGRPDAAVPPQGEALTELQQGLQDMAQQMMQRMMGNNRPQNGQQQRMGRGPGRDPLGRQLPGNGMGGGEQVKIPEEADIQRAREILDELRRRAGEQNRPRQELDYIDRLLDRF